MSEEKLIILVSKYPCLFDVSDAKYSDQVCKENAWEEIANLISNSVADCKKKWTRIRDNYRKAMKARMSKSGDAAMPKRSIKYEKELEFLKPFLGDKNRISNISDSESHGHHVETESSLSAPDNITRTTARKHSRPPTTGEVLEKYLKHQEIVGKSDPITTFFLSMADTVKTFPRSLQLQVRRQIFDVVENAESTLLSQEGTECTTSTSTQFMSNAGSTGYTSASEYSSISQQGYSTQIYNYDSMNTSNPEQTDSIS